MKFKLSAKKLSLRKRFIALSIQDRWSSSQMIAAFNAITIIIVRRVDDDVIELGISRKTAFT